MLEVGQLEDLGRDGGQTVAVETENLQTAGQVGEAARLQPRDAVVVQEAARQNATNGLSQERDASGPDSIYDPPTLRHSQVLERQRGEGAGPDVADGVVAEIQRFQAQEGLQLLRGDPRDPVVRSENTHTHVRKCQTIARKETPSAVISLLLVPRREQITNPRFSSRGPEDPSGSQMCYFVY